MGCSAGLAHLSLQGYRQFDARFLGLTLQKTDRSDPLFSEPLNCNKETTNSDTLSVFLLLQSWLCVGMLCKRTIFCVGYMRI